MKAEFKTQVESLEMEDLMVRISSELKIHDATTGNSSCCIDNMPSAF